MEHKLVVLANKINFISLEKAFSPLYSKTGMPSKPILLMVGLLILKQMKKLADETIMSVGVQNSYIQYFCGETFFNIVLLATLSDLVHFRKRIGHKGVEKILEQSILLFEKNDSRSRNYC